MKTSKKILSIILAVLILFGVFACSTPVLAEEYNNYILEQEYQDKLLTEVIENDSSKAAIVYEIPEKRDEFSKTYKRADGSLTKIFSQIPLHTFDGSEWKEIDNSLQVNGEVIENADGKFDIEFPGDLSTDNKITIENDGENISFSLNDINDSSALIESETSTTDVVQNDLSKPVSEITYENVDEDTDIQYVVYSNFVKENIIVNNKDGLKDSYSFEIEKGNLTAIYNDDNSIHFKNEQDEIVFVIPAPVMVDSAGAISFEIDVSIANENTGMLTLTYTPSKEWLENTNRMYPITIDPVIEIPSNNESVIEDTMIAYDCTQAETRYMNFKNQSECAVVNTGTITNNNFLRADILVNVNMSVFSGLKNPEIEITNASYYASARVTGGNIFLKEINGTWDADTITYDDVYPVDNSSVILPKSTLTLIIKTECREQAY